MKCEGSQQAATLTSQREDKAGIRYNGGTLYWLAALSRGSGYSRKLDKGQVRLATSWKDIVKDYVCRFRARWVRIWVCKGAKPREPMNNRLPVFTHPNRGEGDVKYENNGLTKHHILPALTRSPKLRQYYILVLWRVDKRDDGWIQRGQV